MSVIEKLGESRDVWLQCPGCGGLYYIDRLFFQPGFNQLKVRCPHCSLEFDKAESPRTWG